MVTLTGSSSPVGGAWLLVGESWSGGAVVGIGEAALGRDMAGTGRESVGVREDGHLTGFCIWTQQGGHWELLAKELTKIVAKPRLCVEDKNICWFTKSCSCA